MSRSAIPPPDPMETEFLALERNRGLLERLPSIPETPSIMESPLMDLSAAIPHTGIGGDQDILPPKNTIQKAYRRARGSVQLPLTIGTERSARSIMRGVAGVAFGVGISTIIGASWPVILLSAAVGTIRGVIAPRVRRLYKAATAPEDTHPYPTTKSGAKPLTCDEALECLGIPQDRAEDFSFIRNKYERAVRELTNRISSVPDMFAKQIQATLFKYDKAYEVLQAREIQRREILSENNITELTGVRGFSEVHDPFINRTSENKDSLNID